MEPTDYQVTIGLRGDIGESGVIQSCDDILILAPLEVLGRRWDVVGKVGFKAPADPAKEATLEINRSMVAAVDFTAADGTPKLKLYGGSEIGTLNAVDGLVILSDGLADNTIHFLAPAADATLKIEGTRRLSILDGTKDVKWNVEVQLLFSAEFA